MKFRRLYWVTERVEEDGQSAVTGVYTSIPNLIHKGLRDLTREEVDLRLSLMRLDSPAGPLHQWHAPRFEGLEQVLRQYVKTGDFSHGEIDQLAETLESKKLITRSA